MDFRHNLAESFPSRSLEEIASLVDDICRQSFISFAVEESLANELVTTIYTRFAATIDIPRTLNHTFTLFEPLLDKPS